MFPYSGIILKPMFHNPDQVEFQPMDMVRVEVIIMHQEVVHDKNDNFVYVYFTILFYSFCASCTWAFRSPKCIPNEASTTA